MRLIELFNAGLTLNHQRILERINFRLERGEVVWLRGANGAGKSSLLKLLRGDAWPTAGKRLYHFTTPPRESPIGAKERIAIVTPEMQERYQRLSFTATGLEVVETGFAHSDYLYTPLTPPQLERARDVMRELQLAHLMEHAANALSQGQLRQVLLARALVSNPDVLLLDEFFAGVDPSAKARLKTIVEASTQDGLTLVYTTHRDAEHLSTTTREVRLEAGRIVKARGRVKGPPPVRAKPALPLGPESLIEIQNANVYLGEARDDATALDGHALSGKKHVLHDLSFTLARGEHTALVGQNGAGKTTLSKVMLGEISPALGGTLRWFGNPHTPLWERLARIGLVSSDTGMRHRVDADGFTIVASGFSGGVGWHRRLEPEETARVHDTLELLEVNHLATRNALQVSQGELRKLLIARALVTQPDVLILDEAFDYLDVHSRDALFQTLGSRAASITFLVIAHRRDDIPDWLHRAVKLEAGRVIWQGALSDLEL